MATKKLVIGLGTGRCGTQSLAKLMFNQTGTVATHEGGDNLPWEMDSTKGLCKFHALTSINADIVCDVAFYLLPYVELFREACRVYKIEFHAVALKRDRESTIKSYMNWTEGRNHWAEHSDTVWRKDAIWDPCYPKYDEMDKALAVGRYYDDYYETCKRLNIPIFQMEELNHTDGVRMILNYCGVDEDKHNVIVGLKENVGRAG